MYGNFVKPALSHIRFRSRAISPAQAWGISLENKLPDRLFVLDVLRGMAAIAVVFWHWQHFFFIGGQPSSRVGTEQMPFHGIAWVLYRYGDLGVDFFFALSGFIFFWLFAENIASGRIRLASFAMDRFSRLYPLHIVTFALVGALQALYATTHGTFFVYQINDLRHAILNLFLIPAWGLERGWSFNAPVWSVSIEMLLYIVFAVICLTGRLRYLLALVLIVIGFVLPPDYYKIANGLRQFFFGALTYAGLCLTLAISSKRASALAWTVIATGAVLATIYLGPKGEIRFLTFPLVVAAFAAIGTWKRDMGSNWKWLGDISYSFYLLHFPLQIIFALTFDAFGYERSIFLSPFVMASYFCCLLVMSSLTYYAFEVPVKNMLRSRFAGRGKTLKEGKIISSEHTG
jgi:peptidoglycan/LPS O-acetylase OafA/YrhL